jgi:hypothetical protein
MHDRRTRRDALEIEAAKSVAQLASFHIDDYFAADSP